MTVEKQLDELISRTRENIVLMIDNELAMLKKQMLLMLDQQAAQAGEVSPPKDVAAPAAVSLEKTPTGVSEKEKEPSVAPTPAPPIESAAIQLNPATLTFDTPEEIAATPPPTPVVSEPTPPTPVVEAVPEEEPVVEKPTLAPGTICPDCGGSGIMQINFGSEADPILEDVECPCGAKPPAPEEKPAVVVPEVASETPTPADYEAVFQDTDVTFLDGLFDKLSGRTDADTTENVSAT